MQDLAEAQDRLAAAALRYLAAHRQRVARPSGPSPSLMPALYEAQVKLVDAAIEAEGAYAQQSHLEGASQTNAPDR